ncbi:hypothetical protein ISN44_As11g010620 [Arabidopsis suecica]|uniref:Uncharacterized protein n=1 Tax=Arabidopsis suecica TaxID=45249 RepID=A0A8T1Z8E5_ARASU|nr:hypothetical protein ISN44_As11g010620 [Arabidopsis suecica]
MLCMKERENSSTYELSQLSTSKGESKVWLLHLNPWNKIGFNGEKFGVYVLKILGIIVSM